MFTKILTSAALVLALVLQASAHAAVAPALGVSGGKPVRANVQRPSNANVCGSINVANTINSATTVTANTNGVFTVTATNFNGYVHDSICWYPSAYSWALLGVPMAHANSRPKSMPLARAPNSPPPRLPPTVKAYVIFVVQAITHFFNCLSRIPPMSDPNNWLLHYPKARIARVDRLATNVSL